MVCPCYKLICYVTLKTKGEYIGTFPILFSEETVKGTTNSRHTNKNYNRSSPSTNFSFNRPNPCSVDIYSIYINVFIHVFCSC